jgi:hypothetical protein
MKGPIYTHTGFNQDHYTCKYCDHIKMDGRTSYGCYGCSLIKTEIEILSTAYSTPSSCPLLIKVIRRRKLKRLNSL